MNLSRYSDPALVIVEREQVTHFSGVPTMTYELVNSQDFGSCGIRDEIFKELSKE